MFHISGLTQALYVTPFFFLDSQNPQCEGFHKCRTLFNSKAQNSRPKLLKISRTTSGSYELGGGEASGITLNTQFNVYTDRNPDSFPIGILTATSVSAYTARCEVVQNAPDLPLPSNATAYALQTRVDASTGMSLSIPEDPFFSDITLMLKEEMQRGLRIRLVVFNSSPPPDVVLKRIGDSTLAFEIRDKTCRDWGLTELCHRIYRNPTTTSSSESFVEESLTVIKCAADFFFHLNRYPRYGNLSSSGLVRLESYELEEGFVGGEWGMTEKEPRLNLINNNTLHVYDYDEKVFGFKVVNNSALPLYIALFFFEMSDLSISQHISFR